MARWLDAARIKGRNVTRGLLQRYGTSSIKKRLWDREFSRGRWDCLDRMPNDCLYPHVERHANHGSVLDLGCGPGTTGTELAAEAYTCYTGVDVSQVAVEKARKRAEEHRRADKNSYLQADLISYVPNGPQDVILFGDSLYYTPVRLILSVLNRYSTYLKPSGVFVVRIYGSPYQKIMDIIEDHFDVVDKRVYVDQVFVLTFRPSARGQS